MSGPCRSTQAWRRLLAHRFELDGTVPSEVAEALAHLDVCPTCRARAVAVDPLLVFRGARALPEPADAAAMVDAVRAGRRLRSVERRASARRSAGVAAALVAGALLLAPTALYRASEAPEPGAPEISVAPAAVPSDSPLIENLDRPGARVYQWGSEAVSVVMVVDESLDV
ncbi:MAG: hypothetical protein R2991_14925 [Thermoanaerobaculia bacterium]